MLLYIYENIYIVSGDRKYIHMDGPEFWKVIEGHPHPWQIMDNQLPGSGELSICSAAGADCSRPRWEWTARFQVGTMSYVAVGTSSLFAVLLPGNITVLILQ